MQSEDREEFVRILTGLADVKRVNLTAEAFEIWWLAMQDWSIDDFRQAAGYVAKHAPWLDPHEFEKVRKRAAPSEHEAWIVAVEHASGAWRHSSTCGDLQIDAVVQSIGGYHTLAMCDGDKLGFLERRFLETYRDFADGQAVRQALPNLSETPVARIGGTAHVGKLLEHVSRQPSQPERN